jgi:hypothetical protein
VELSGQLYVPAVLPPQKSPLVLIEKEAVVVLITWRRENSGPCQYSNSNPYFVQTSHYTNNAIAALFF